MTADELAEYHGQNGQPAYVAVGGTIYDVTTSPLWQNGHHAQLHQAGCDLSEELNTAPHIKAVITRFPSVGQLEEPRRAVTHNIKPGSAVALAITLIIAWLLWR